MGGLWKWGFWALLVLSVSTAGRVEGGDIVHDDEDAPKRPGCKNDFVLVGFWDLGFAFSCEILVGGL